MIRMPGESFAGTLPDWTEEEKELAVVLEGHVRALAEEIGERNIYTPENYRRAATYIQEQFAASGYEVRLQSYRARGVESFNLEVEVPGTTHPQEILVVGAHYDTVSQSPGANDNASGIAGTLALAALFRDAAPHRTLRFVAFANEEWPFFQTGEMGSMRYAEAAQQRGENIIGMISLETIGYFSEESGSQRYPFPFNLFYPSTGNFIAFVANTHSSDLVRDVVRRFRETTSLPSEGAALPERVPGVGWSDHSAFWNAGYPALMVTDTAPYRYPHYHQAEDTPEKLDYHRMARLMTGLKHVLTELASER
jgi:Zn-dependent M28 family amino/carboxypeptidase